MQIYQIFFRLFHGKKDEVAKFNHIDNACLKGIRDIGISHIWYIGILDHATTTAYPHRDADSEAFVKGKAGSPYAVRNYYDVCADFAQSTQNRMQEFEKMLERTHKSGLGVLIDFVPNHVARSYRDELEDGIGKHEDPSKTFDLSNDFYYLEGDLRLPSRTEYVESPAKASGNDCFSTHPSKYDWLDTIKLNYGIDREGNTHFEPIPKLWFKMRDILVYWLEKGVDGFRCDMIHMVPLAFWKWLMKDIKAHFPKAVFIGEIYDPNIYRAFIEVGFDYLYDKVDLYDSLKNILMHGHSVREITSCWQRNHDILPNLLNFLENHDEQRIASRFFAEDPFRALPAMTVTSCLTSASTMLYFGQELGEDGKEPSGCYSGDDGRTSIYDYGTVPSIASWLDQKEPLQKEPLIRKHYRQLLNTTAKSKAIRKGAMFDLQYFNEENAHYPSDDVFSFMRHYDKEVLLIVANFRDKAYQLSLRIPNHAFDFIALSLHKHSFWKTKDLLSNSKEKWKVQNPEKGIDMSIQAYQSRIYRLKFDD